MITGHTKLERVHDLLADRLPSGRAGTAIVFRATREATVGTAEFLQTKGWRAAHFHAGLTARKANSGRVPRWRPPGDLRDERLRHGH
jgi:superfamily II DNA helicase RecQ